MKVGILGTGMIVKALLKTVDLLDFESMYILGTEQTKNETEELAMLYGIEKCFYNYDEMLKTDIDTVYVALPNHLHYSFAKKALKSKKHVIIEKPITSNYEELKDLVSIAQENNLIILEAMNIHYLPAYKSIKDVLPKLGKLKIISLNYSQYSSRYDAFKNGDILPAFDYHKSGGALMDINVYNIHFIVGLFGKPHSIQYQANIENHIDTSGILILDYVSFKVVCIGAKDCKAPIVSTIQGDDGCLIIDKPANSFTKYELVLNDNKKSIYDFDDGKHRLYYEFKTFISIIDQKDYKRSNEMLAISSMASEIMQEARCQVGIKFDSDK